MKSKVFSERHEKVLREKKLKLSFRQELRRAVYQLFTRNCEWGGWDNSENFTEENVIRSILNRRGWKKLEWWDGKKMNPTESFEGFIEKGTPHHFLDAIELFTEELDSNKRPAFWIELNTLFDIHHAPVRFFRGEFYVIDSSFLESQVMNQAQELLEQSGYHGPLDEFRRAREAYTGKDFKQAVLLANHAFESTMKAVLGAPVKKPGELIKKICYSGLAPSYYEGFLNSFHDILSIVAMTRDNEAGHGQGKDIKTVQPALAELVLHLSGSLIVFLIKRQMERTPPEDSTDDVPF